MKSRGFSLLEVVVALTILGIGLSVIFAGMSGSIRSLDRAETAGRRVELARLKLAELDLMKRIPLRDSATGMFEDGTQWTLSTSPFIPPVEEGPKRNPSSVIRIDLTLEWTGRNGPQRQMIQTYRYQTEDGRPVPALEEQLRELR